MLNNYRGKTMKRCIVPIDKAQQLCPDPRIFNCCSRALSFCKSKEEFIKTLKSWNKFCEANKCMYLEEENKQ